MKIKSKTLILLGAIIINIIFLFSIYTQYYLFHFNFPEIESNINYFDPSPELKLRLLQEGKVIVIIYNSSKISEEEIKNLANIFLNNVTFFILNATFSQAFIVSSFYEKSILNITYENLLKEICRASLNPPKECIEII